MVQLSHKSQQQFILNLQDKSQQKMSRYIFETLYFSIKTNQQKKLSPSKRVFPSYQGESTIFDNGISSLPPDTKNK